MTAIGSRTRSRDMVTSYADDLRLYRTGWSKVALALLVALWALGPLLLPDFAVQVLNFAGVFAIGAIGLNLLTGFTGQVSLGHAFFLGAGAYAMAWLGSTHDLPLLIWLPAVAAIGALIGAAVGPFALRLRGNYLVIVTLGLVFVGEHVFEQWESLTGGAGTGRNVAGSLEVGPIDFGGMDLLGLQIEREQGLFWLIWGLALLSAVAVRNIVRSRPGRAMQAIRDRDLAAEVIGVSLLRYKVAAFAASSALAAVAGAMQGSLLQFAAPEQWNLILSIQFVAIIIVGGLGTVFGSVIGAVVLGSLPRIIEEVSQNQDLPLVYGDRGGAEGVISVFALNQVIFGALLVAFLIFEPRGLAAVWLRFKAYLKTWPFSY